MRWQTLYEGRWIFAVLAALTVVAWLFLPWLSLLFIALILYTFAFFRDPERVSPQDAESVVAAADGVVADVVEIEEMEVVKTTMKRVGIFLSVFDVHTNRAPIEGKIVYRQHREGLCLDARSPDCSGKNESMTWAFANPRATLVVKQLTGAVARRIVGWSKIGDTVEKANASA